MWKIKQIGTTEVLKIKFSMKLRKIKFWSSSEYVYNICECRYAISFIH